MNIELYKDVMSRLHNAKFESALNLVIGLDISPELMKQFEYASYFFGNCGWGGDGIYNEAERLMWKLSIELGLEYTGKETLIKLFSEG